MLSTKTKKKALSVKKIAENSGIAHKPVSSKEKQGTYGVKVNNRALSS
jgi:hypothetical protein